MPARILESPLFNITLLTRMLNQIRSVVGLPDEIQQKIIALATLNRTARDTHSDRRKDAEAAAVAALIETAGTGKSLPVDVEAKVTEAASLDASSDARNTLVRRAVEVAEYGAAQDHADEIVIDGLRPKVEKVLECLPDAARLIPPGMDDATAFRAPSEVQNAYRQLTETADLVNRVMEVRRQMCNNAGNAAAIDFPAPIVFTPAYSGGLQYGLVGNFYDFEKAGTWPAGDMSMSDRCSRCTARGPSFTLGTGEEITAMVAADIVRHRADNPPTAKQPVKRAVAS